MLPAQIVKLPAGKHLEATTPSYSGLTTGDFGSAQINDPGDWVLVSPVARPSTPIGNLAGAVQFKVSAPVLRFRFITHIVEEKRTTNTCIDLDTPDITRKAPRYQSRLHRAAPFGGDPKDGLGLRTTEVGSDLVPTETTFEVSHNGQSRIVHGHVGIMLTPAYAGDGSDTECTEPDTCDGSGSCQDNHEADTVTCTW